MHGYLAQLPEKVVKDAVASALAEVDTGKLLRPLQLQKIYRQPGTLYAAGSTVAGGHLIEGLTVAGHY